MNPNLFTLVLLTNGRHNFTERWLKYMHEISFNYKILIGDGSNDENTNKLVSKINNDKKLDIEVYNYNTLNSYEEYYKMEFEIISKVSTKYVMLCDNDDFIIKSGVEEVINYLEKNNQYISASGKIANFEINNYQFVDYGNKVNFIGFCLYQRKKEPLESFEDQIKSTFKDFQPNFYNVFKTEYLLQISKELTQLNFSDLVVNEFYIQLRAPILGKNIILENSCHYIRQRGTSSLSSGYVFSIDLLKKNLPKDVRKMSEKISNLLSLNDNNKLAEYNTLILESYSNYLNFYLSNTTLRYRFKKLYKTKLFFLSIKNKLFNIIDPIYLIFFGNIKNIRDIKSKKIQNEIKKIIKFLKI